MDKIINDDLKTFMNHRGFVKLISSSIIPAVQ